MADRFNSGDHVFVACPEHKDAAFLAGQITSISSCDVATVKISDKNAADVDEERQVPCCELRARFARNDTSTCQDNTALVHMNDAMIMQNLQLRHKQDEIYTYTASVLLAMNPYKDIGGLYSEQQCARYRGKHIGALPPHPYAIADTAYRALVRDQKNQGLLISGESGAGKTETAKIVMQYLSFASGAASDLATRIQTRVLNAQPILESLGNAVTMRNSNSSRFGKYNRVFFDDSGTLVDAGITTYLLESSRVVVHGVGERTYHCFYEMLSGLTAEKLEEFKLERGKNYRLLSNGKMVGGFQERDAANFKRLCESLKTVGLTDEDVDDSLRILAGLIHLGDVIKDTGDAVAGEEDTDQEVKLVDLDDECSKRAASLLGMDPDDLFATLKRKKVAVPGRNSFHEVPRTVFQARQALHSLIKAIYKRLFEFIVNRINDSFKELRPECVANDSEEAPDPEWRHIGILDIYGFERLQKNSFEQLCINLANERLQQYFVENVLRAEESLYKREGLAWTEITLPDSQPVVNCIAKVFLKLDEYSQQVAKGVGNCTDQTFCQKITEESMKDERKEVLKKLKMSNNRLSTGGAKMNDGFAIKHYAGWVDYNTSGWLDKNNDRLLSECESLICDSQRPFVKSLGEENSKVPFRSISKKYSTDLEMLLKTLGTCNLHYIRCFKPNAEQKPNIFRQQLVLDQIIQCGTIELVKIMHDGYPNRVGFEELTRRFKDLLPEKFQRYGMRTFIEALMLVYDVPRDQWELGMSRLFLKAGQLKALEDMRSGGVKPDPDKLAAIVSGIIRKRWKRAIQSVSLCLYVPRFISMIYQKRAAKALVRVAQVTARLQPRLAAAQGRVKERRLKARRRFLAAAFTVRCLQASWRQIRSARRERLVSFLFRTSRLRSLFMSHPRFVAARARARDLALQREAERLREEERQRQERQRLADERTRMEEERKRMEEERLEREAAQKAEEERLQEERRVLEQRQEEDRQQQLQKQLELAKQKELEMAKQLQQQALELEQQREAQRLEDQKRAEEERQKLEEERKALEAEREAFQMEKRRSMITAQATPQHSWKSQGQTQHSETETTVTAAGEEDYSDIGDSVSVAANAAMMQQLVQKEMDARMAVLEKDMARKQEEMLKQMSHLQEKNEKLEKQLSEEHRKKPVATPRDVEPAEAQRHVPCPASPDPHDASPLQLGDSPIALATPDPPSSGKRSSHRLSAYDRPLGGSSEGQSRRRKSVAAEAFSATRQSGAMSMHSMGEPVSKDQNINSQRKWWQQQRQFLLGDLYGHSNSSPMGSPMGPPGRGSSSQRRSIVNPLTTEAAGRAVPEAVVEDADGEAAAQQAAPRQTRKNLNDQFDTVEPGERELEEEEDLQGATKMRQPTQFSWKQKA